MALSGKYGRLDIPRIGEEEPVFILRAQDKLAQPTVNKIIAEEKSHLRQLSELKRKLAAI